MNKTKFFTVEKANKTLPLVKKIVKDILNAGQEIRTLSTRIGTGAEADPQVIRWMNQLEDLFQELEALGCSYRDWNFTAGLVDFPAMLNGEEVCLCWKSDEEELKYYHGLEEGFAGRRLISK